MGNILKFDPGDTVILKKPHPCGERGFNVVRVGSTVRIVCRKCGRDLELDRLKLEKSIKEIISQNNGGNV